MSKNHATDNIYNILNTLKSLEPTPEQTVKAEAKRIYESVAAQGSIIAGVAGVEARLRQQFAESDFSDTSKAIQKSGKSKASADAITASIGRKKLGQAEMTRRSVAGKKHAHEGVAEGSLEKTATGLKHHGDFPDYTGSKGRQFKADPDKLKKSETSRLDKAFGVHWEPTNKRKEITGDPSGVAEGTGQQLSIEQLATISDTALDSAYGYGRSQPGNTFGWQANLKSAAFAKQMIDKGVADIEAISDAIHKGWNVTAQAFVKNPQMFDDSKTMAPEKLQAKIAQRQKLMTQQYAQLPEDEKEKDRVVARAMLQAITGGQQEVGEDMEPEDLGTVAEINRLIAKGMHETDAIHAVAKKYGDNPSELASFYYQHNMHEGTVHKGTYGTSYDPSDEEKRDKPKREIKHGQKGRPRAEKPMDSKSAPKGDIFGRTTGEVPKGKRGTKIKGHGNIDESTSYQKQNFMFESFNFANMMKETDQTVQEMLTELQGDIATFKMTGECSPKLDAFLRVHGHSKKQLADEAKVTPNYEVPAVQRKAAGEPALSLGDVQAHDANRSMHPGMTKLDAPKPANIHDELDELAELAGITKVTDEGNAFTGKLASTAHGDDFELDGKHYTDTSKLDEAMCNECGMYESQCSCTEGNLFTKYLKDTPKGGEFEIDGKHYTDTSNLDEASMKLEDMARLAGIAVEGRDYGDTAFNKPPTYDNTPNEEVQGEDVMLKGGDGEVAGGEKKMTKGGYNFSDNPLAMKESAADLMKEAADFDPMEAMGRRLMKQYEAIKVAK